LEQREFKYQHLVLHLHRSKCDYFCGHGFHCSSCKTQTVRQIIQSLARRS